jgi:MoaA/NifB/PqqE/SkfB family radical SAM enzyme
VSDHPLVGLTQQPLTPREALRLGAFLARLATKEHVAPRVPVPPLVAELFLTENCNLRCISCACWRTQSHDELSTSEWQSVLQQLVEMRIYKVNFTGGEPLIRPDAVDLMEFAKRAGVRHMHLNTNGIRLDDEMLSRILDAGVRSFNVSVDGPNALVHDRIRGRIGAFKTTMGALETLIEARARYGLRLRMNFTVMRDNVRFLPDMALLAQRMQVQLYLNLATDTTFLFRDPEVTDQTRIDDEVLTSTMRQLEAIARSDTRWLPRYSDLEYVRGHFRDLVQRQLPCAESQLKLMIRSRGEVGGCWGEDTSLNVRERRLRDILDSEQYRAEHERFFRKDCVGCGSNYSLNLRWRPTTYLHDWQWRRGERSLVG